MSRMTIRKSQIKSRFHFTLATSFLLLVGGEAMKLHFPLGVGIKCKRMKIKLYEPVERWGSKKNVDKWASRFGLMSLMQFKIGECAVA